MNFSLDSRCSLASNVFPSFFFSFTFPFVSLFSSISFMSLGVSSRWQTALQKKKPYFPLRYTCISCPLRWKVLRIWELELKWKYKKLIFPRVLAAYWEIICYLCKTSLSKISCNRYLISNYMHKYVITHLCIYESFILLYDIGIWPNNMLLCFTIHENMEIWKYITMKIRIYGNDIFLSSGVWLLFCEYSFMSKNFICVIFVLSISFSFLECNSWYAS